MDFQEIVYNELTLPIVLQLFIDGKLIGDSSNLGEVA
jgi:hypothetical protein